MDYSNAIHIIPDAAGPDAWANAPPPAGGDSGIWATEDDYRQWNGDPGEQPPPGKKPRSGGGGGGVSSGGGGDGGGGSTSKSRAIGKMFFKTKLCCKFRAGTCPYVTNCNFAHGMEELRKPPPNWQEIVAAHEEATEQREEHQIPIMTSASVVAGDGGGSSQGGRAYKGRHCKKFYTEEGCPYGDACTFLHDEQSKARESVAISLSPSVGGGGYNAAAANGVQVQKPSNWKTRICNKWEMTGYCPFGSKCHFAHGAAGEFRTELHKYGGGLVDLDNNAASTPDSKQAGVSAKAPADAAAAANSIPPHADVYHLGIQSQRSTLAGQRSGQVQRPIQKWKGPDKISRIYGDWIDENE
ncbi:hypothetical protein PR202_gb28736 [Eleusine coracana subsp. coracana]|uniref:C3H1-type domain-containing protein n=1 Tax=Eleusine coracana subsp. coracana TaxID=191504 RepID=A0AAV5FY14_ELECO|nr:hypothetical protein PR202_gb28736 [Eleusine coracana subsp. coracana]